MALTEARVRAIVREELVAMLTGAATPTAAKAPASTKASSTVAPEATTKSCSCGREFGQPRKVSEVAAAGELGLCGLKGLKAHSGPKA